MNGRYQQGGQDNPLEKLKRELRNRAITQFSERELFHPNGHAKAVVKDANITAVQLRKVFQEFKAIVDGLRKDNNLEKAMGRLYKLYALLEYQAERGVLNKDFKDLMFKLFDNIEKHKSPQAFERAYDLLMAMVAYSKKS
ncbi:MAG: type III-A CRISPR-associated protein Csm2 [Thermocrinis sp.]|jgi:CRISPR type III-A-associated protein Csm2|nr:type III-A CRISPR-associated protein Csm2 [Thermocrinis sp.]